MLYVRRILYLAIGAVLLIGVCALDGVQMHASAADEVQRVAVNPGRGAQKISFRDRLLVGLQARLKSEVAFVDEVVEEVQDGRLPQRLVDETFFWARQRGLEGNSGRARRPIIFFQPAMRARAKRLGVSL